MKLGKQLWTILYINFPNSYSCIWLIWNILHEWYRSSIGVWAALDILQIQRIERLWSTFRWVKYVAGTLPQVRIAYWRWGYIKEKETFCNILISEIGWSLKICWSLESIVVPKYLVELTCSDGTLLQLMFRVTGRLWLLNKIVLVLDRFNVSLFFCNQLNTLFISILVFFSKLLGLVSEISDGVSSAKILQKKLEDSGRSLIYNKNSTGPRVEPCGTPQVICILSDWTSFAKTNCCLFFKYDVKKSRANPRIP